MLNLIPSSERPDKMPLVHLIRGDMDFDPGLAARVIAECHYERQRRLREYHVEELAVEMQHRRFTQGTQVAFGRLKDRLYLVNGQHTMHAIVKSGLTQYLAVLIEDVETYDDLGPLYNRFDNQATRTWHDSVRAMGISDKTSLTDAQAAATLSAVLLIQTGFRVPTISNFPTEMKSRDARFQAAKPWWPYAEKYFALIEGADNFIRPRLKRQAVVAVALMTLKYQPEIAPDFWIGVANDDGLRRGDPRKTLFRHLIENTSGKLGSPSIQLRAIATTWNAWMENRQLTFIRVYPDSPLVIRGTPIGRQIKRRK